MSLQNHQLSSKSPFTDSYTQPLNVDQSESSPYVYSGIKVHPRILDSRVNPLFRTLEFSPMMNQIESSNSKGTEKDFSKAIPERKKVANRLIVDVAINYDNSIVAMHPDTMEKLPLSHGDKILIKGKKGKDTLCIALADDTCHELEPKIRMNKVVRAKAYKSR